ncbi:MAG TPA: response regulator [Verrucomicrobiae bacterium]|jgi:DNA-binding response OmpR family regulator|nr:response regulator [Verrucomicrobiae bacterium]
MQPKKILVVDDEWSVLELLRIKLSKRGFQVDTARNEKEFRDHAFRGKPDLLILDIWLGNDGGGTEAYDRAVRDGFDATVPVIFISALVDEGSSPKRAAGGRFALYGKPFDFDLLLEDIHHLTGLGPPREGAVQTGAAAGHHFDKGDDIHKEAV